MGEAQAVTHTDYSFGPTSQPSLLTDRPPAVVRVEKGFAYVCAWHRPAPTAARAAGSWARANGLQVSHTICPECERRDFPEAAAKREERIAKR